MSASVRMRFPRQRLQPAQPPAPTAENCVPFDQAAQDLCIEQKSLYRRMVRKHPEGIVWGEKTIKVIVGIRPNVYETMKSQM